MGVYNGKPKVESPWIQNNDVPKIFYHNCEMKKEERLYEKLIMHANRLVGACIKS